MKAIAYTTWKVNPINELAFHLWWSKIFRHNFLSNIEGRER